MPSDYGEICKDNIRRRGEEFDDIGRLISEQLYSDRSHFVYELLQNAEDALDRRFRRNRNDSTPCKVQFRLFQDRLEFRHYGVPFDEKDVRGISDVLKGTKKEDVIQIGKFGIGFKSVYAFTASPEIHSGEEHFVIKRYIRPEAKELELSIAESETVFNFPFDHEDLTAGEAFDLILNRLRRLGPRTLLFLRRIDEIEWSVEPNEEKGQYLKEVKKCKNARRVTVVCQNKSQDAEGNWLIFERPVPVSGSGDQVRVEVGFRIEINTKDKTESITRIKDAPLVAYFPTEKDTKLGFLIQGPYRTTPARDNIPKDDDRNKTLIAETAQLVVESLRQLKEMGLLSVSLLEALPIRADDVPEDSMFYPIYAAVRDALMNEELLPADDGAFVAARNARLASAEWLHRLLPEEQLRQLYKTEDHLKWISGEVTERAKQDLWKFMREELEIEEVTPDSFARKVDLDFFQRQTDQWMIEFYQELVNQRALWKKISYTSYDDVGPLRAKPFIRLENGSHVAPFLGDDSPAAYLPAGAISDMSLPIVRTVLIQDESARRFLTELGLPELDIVTEIIENVLPKYTSSSPSVSFEEHKHDVETIQQAYKTDSHEKKQRLKDALQKTPFLLAQTPGSDRSAYRKPAELYLPDDILKMYFSGNLEVGCVSSVYEESALEMFKGLGVSEGVRVSRKYPDHRGFITIEARHGRHERGLNGFDPEMRAEGLEYALASPSLEKSSFVWNHIAVPNCSCVRGTVEKSSLKTFEDCSRKDSPSENFGRLLIDNSWLPGPDGVFRKPSELRLDDLPEAFERNEKLADLLGMKRDIVAILAEKAGIPVENIELARRYPEEFQRWADNIAAQTSKPKFPTRPVANPERRKKQLTEQFNETQEKKYEPRTRSVRITEATEYTRVWLKELYTNDEGLMSCQICKREMPFRKRNGGYYFEAVEALSRDHFAREHEAQFLVLCPLCAAKYKEFVKHDEDAMRAMKNALMNSDGPVIPLCLGKEETGVQFVESHFFDIKTVLEEEMRRRNEIT